MQDSVHRVRRTVWIWITAVAALILSSYYALRSDPSPAKAESAATESGAPSLSERLVTIEPAPAAKRNAVQREAASEPKLAVNGVMIASASRSALISVGDQPARLFAEGDRIADGVTLYAVSPDRVVVARGGELLRFQVRGAASTVGEPAILREAETDSADPPQPTPPPGTEERRIYQSQNRD